MPVKKYLPKTPYEYTVKGASTHYVDNNEGRYHTAPERPSPHPQTQQPPRVQPFSFDSMFVQSGNTKSSHEFSGLKQGAGGQGYQHDRGFDHSHAQHAPPPPDTSSMHKVKVILLRCKYNFTWCPKKFSFNFQSLVII